MATPRFVTVAATQFACSSGTGENVELAEALVRRAANAGANVILLQELFATQYFCQEQHDTHYAKAEEEKSSQLLQRFEKLAAELGVVLPVSFFERGNNAFFNSVVVFDTDGKRLGLYRKSHIPDGPGYQEKFYFAPGDTGFKVFETKVGKIGVAICWDQWFPEAARTMALMGAEANMVPVVASNRVGREEFSGSHVTFYGSSFIADHTGDIVAECPYTGADVVGTDVGKKERTKEGQFAWKTFDLEAIRLQRASWGLFRDRRPTLYRPLLSLDGRVPP